MPLTTLLSARAVHGSRPLLCCRSAAPFSSNERTSSSTSLLARPCTSSASVASAASQRATGRLRAREAGDGERNLNGSHRALSTYARSGPRVQGTPRGIRHAQKPLALPQALALTRCPLQSPAHRPARRTRPRGVASPARGTACPQAISHTRARAGASNNPEPMPDVSRALHWDGYGGHS